MREYVKNRLICAARQFRHNTDNSPDLCNPREGFAIAYDKEEVDELVEELDKTDEPTYLFTVRYMNTCLAAADVEHYGKLAKIFARNAEEAKEKLKQVVEKPSYHQRLVMEIEKIEEIL